MTNTLSDLTMQGDIDVGSNNIAMTGDLSSGGAPVNAGWFTNLTVGQVNAPTTAGIAIQGRTDGGYPASGYIGETITAESRINASSTVTISIASPGVVNYTASGIVTGMAVFFTTTGSLPTGLSPNTNYYAIRINANSFSLATSVANAHAGTAITTSGSQSGTHTCRIGIYMTSSTLIDLVGLSIPAGVWMFAATGWHVAQSSAAISQVGGAITTTSGSQIDYNNGGYYQNGLSLPANSGFAVGTAPRVFSFSSATIVYFTLRTTYSAGYVVGNGCLSGTRIA